MLINSSRFKFIFNNLGQEFERSCFSKLNRHSPAFSPSSSIRTPHTLLGTEQKTPFAGFSSPPVRPPHALPPNRRRTIPVTPTSLPPSRVTVILQPHYLQG
ncbi:hypothetical protein BT69DRAFT_1286787 [Atractiella rhizophila]|nr:hypothetical protein BT69DRAFT_1286787 [Atractiella rhizophila]